MLKKLLFLLVATFALAACPANNQTNNAAPIDDVVDEAVDNVVDENSVFINIYTSTGESVNAEIRSAAGSENVTLPLTDYAVLRSEENIIVTVQDNCADENTTVIESVKDNEGNNTYVQDTTVNITKFCK